MAACLLAAANLVSVQAGSPSASPHPTAPPEPSGVGRAAVFWLAVSPAYDQTGLVAAVVQSADCSAACLWTSHDGGATWGEVSPRVTATRVWVAADASGHDVIFVLRQADVARSDDGGSTWTRVGDPGFLQTAPSFPADGLAAVATDKGDYTIVKGAVAPVTGSAGALSDSSFMFAPRYPEGGSWAPTLLVGSDKRQGLPMVEQCSADLVCRGGAVLPGAVVFSMPVSLYPSSTYGTDGVVFAQSGRGIYKSTDAGHSFTPLTIGQQGATATATGMFALPPTYSERGPVRSAYAAVLQIFQDAANPKNSHSSGGIYKTTDGGMTWIRVGSPSPLDRGALSVAVAPDGRVFAGYVSSYGQGLLCSADGGAQWAATCPAVGQHKGATASSGSSVLVTPHACSGGDCGRAAAVSPDAITGSTDGNIANGGNPTAGKNRAAARSGSTGGQRWMLGGGALLVVAVLGATALSRRRRAQAK